MKDFLYQDMITYQNDIQHSYMVFELRHENQVIDYQFRIIHENPISQLLSLHKKQIDHKISLFYDITSKVALEQLLKRKKFTKFEFLSMLKDLLVGLKLGDEYLLRGGCFVLDSKYLYVDPVTLKVSIAYLPITDEQDINQSVKEWLMDLLIYNISFSNAVDGDFIYQLLTLMKKESFNLKELDKMIVSLAVEQNTVTVDSRKEEAISELVNGTNNQDLVSQNPAVGNQNLILIFSQVFLAAIAVLLIRSLQSQTSNFDFSKMGGLIMIVAAIDIVVLKKLKLLPKAGQKKAITVSKPPKDKEKARPAKPKKDSSKQSKKASIYPAAASKQGGFADPKEFETRVLFDDAKSIPYLLAMGVNSHEKILINKPSFMIGRVNAQVDYLSKNNAVGKLHAEILLKENDCYIKDLNSRNGTYINGERIVSNVEHILRDNDRVSFANSEYKFFQSERTNNPEQSK